MDLRKKYKEETGEPPYTTWGAKPEYIEWLENELEQRIEAGQHETIVMRKVYLEAKLKGLEEAITAIRNGMGSIKGLAPESIVEKKRKECFSKLRKLNDETA